MDQIVARIIQEYVNVGYSDLRQNTDFINQVIATFNFVLAKLTWLPDDETKSDAQRLIVREVFANRILKELLGQLSDHQNFNC